MSKFIHLHVHTEYSLLDGLPKIKDLVATSKEMGMSSIAITDHGVMYGVIEFYKKAREEGIKPIIGMEGYVVEGDHKKRPERGKVKNNHLLLLAKNNEGYQNLMKLTSIAHLEGYYYRPRFDRETLKKYSKGLICSSACGKGEIGQALINDDYEKAKKIAIWYQETFGKDYYLELQRHFLDKFAKAAKQEEIKRELAEMAEGAKKMEKGIIKLSRSLGIPIIATNDVHYIKKDQAEAQDALVCIATGKNVSDLKRLRYIDMPDLYLKSADEMAEIFSDLPDAIENTVKIAKKCSVEIELGQWIFPKVDLPKGETAAKHLEKESYKKLKERYKKVTKELKKRMKFELEVIIKKGYAPYFLIFQDLANWARERSVPINTRGSAAGSIVSYSLGITTVDPIKHLLPFERFLNPLRPKPPDIDMDISDDKRDEMIGYLVEKYGQGQVAQICTFGRMLARASVRDVARVLGYEYSVGDKIAKLIPLGSQGFPMFVDRAMDESVELRELYNSDEDAKKIIDLAKQIEGNARHVSVHAAGVVIAPYDLTKLSPLQLDPSAEKKLVTQYEMHACEDVGLVKLDILGIRNLSILRESIELVKKTQGKEIKIEEIPLDDKKTFDMLARGETMGTFQLSGSGMTRFLVDLKPERVEDLMAMVALYRPGPMANIPEYIARKKKEKKVSYYHPKMKKFLEKSFGILVYQDDLLFTALELAGYDWKSVDKLRNAVGKKIPEEMKKQHAIFVKGCMEHSDMTKEKAEKLWNLFEPFQGYGFNKAHAASYGMVAYQTSFMKANYPVEFMCALLTAESGDTDKISAAINECRRVGIEVLPPDINESAVDFTIVSGSKGKKAIRFGLSAIKNVGKAAIEAILEARSEGNFVSFADFLSRTDGRRVNKKVLESLIKVGALSTFGKRAALLTSMEEIRSRVTKPKGFENQQGLFSQDELKKSMKADLNKLSSEVEEFSDEELQNLERTLLGFSLSAKPVSELISCFSDFATHKLRDLSAEITNGGVKVAVVIEEVRVVITRTSGKEMAFVKVKDDTGAVDLVVFPKMFKSTRDVWVDNKPCLISGRIDMREDSMSLIVNQVETEDQLGANDEILYIQIPKNTKPFQLKNLKRLLLENPGSQKVCLVFEGKDAVVGSRSKNERKVQLDIGVSWNETLARQILEMLEEK